MSDLVFRGFGGSPEVDVVPNALVDEVDADLQDHIQGAGAEGERGLTRKCIENKGGRGATEDAIADRLDDAPGMAFYVAHCLPIVLYPMGITVIGRKNIFYGRAAK